MDVFPLLQDIGIPHLDYLQLIDWDSLREVPLGPSPTMIWPNLRSLTLYIQEQKIEEEDTDSDSSEAEPYERHCVCDYFQYHQNHFPSIECNISFF